MRTRLAYANVMSTLAFFLALAGGTAVAATALPRNSVGTVHLKKNAVTSAKVKDRSIRGADVDAAQVQLRVGQGCPDGQSIRVIDVKGGVACEVDDRGGSGGGQPSGAAGGDLAGSYPNPSLRNGVVNAAKVADGSLTGAKIANSTLTGSKIATNTLTGDHIDEATLGQVPSARLGGIGRSAGSGTCDPETSVYFTCAYTTIDLPAQTRVLVMGTVKAQAEGSGSNSLGQCRLATSTGVILALSGFNAGRPLDASFVPLIGVTLAGPGRVDFGIECNELDLDIVYFDARVVAVALSPS